MAYFAGSKADLPADKADELEKAGYVEKILDVSGVVESDLPDDLPARGILINAGFNTINKVLAASESLLDIKGIGKATANHIINMLSE